MSAGSEVSEPTLYDILQLQPSRRFIDPVELKLAYRRALLHYHPDKKHASPLTKSNTFDSITSHGFSVDQITKAYKVFSSTKEKAIYDKNLERGNRDSSTSSKANQHAGVDTFDLEELDYADDTDTWSRTCKCGHERAYTLSGRDLESASEQGEICVQCAGCSLFIRVLFETA
jgi:diphthamide biosynthesis protein 4